MGSEGMGGGLCAEEAVVAVRKQEAEFCLLLDYILLLHNVLQEQITGLLTVTEP